MLHELGIEAFVGGNLGNPLSEATFQCLVSPDAKPKFQVILFHWLTFLSVIFMNEVSLALLYDIGNYQFLVSTLMRLKVGTTN